MGPENRTRRTEEFRIPRPVPRYIESSCEDNMSLHHARFSTDQEVDLSIPQSWESPGFPGRFVMSGLTFCACQDTDLRLLSRPDQKFTEN